jgi:hypothetical protein
MSNFKDVFLPPQGPAWCQAAWDKVTYEKEWCTQLNYNMWDNNRNWWKRGSSEPLNPLIKRASGIPDCNIYDSKRSDIIGLVCNIGKAETWYSDVVKANEGGKCDMRYRPWTRPTKARRRV